MKTETISLTTKKNLSEISGILREASSRLHAKVHEGKLAPFGYVNFRKGDIDVSFSGSNFVLGGPRKWGIQIIVVDSGKYREVELTAVGDDFWGKLSQGSFGCDYYELKDGISRAKTIVRFLSD